MGHEARSNAAALAAADAAQAQDARDERLVVAMERQARALEGILDLLRDEVKVGGAFNRSYR